MNSRGFAEYLIGSIEANSQNDIEMEAPAAMFQTVEFESFILSQQHNVVNTTQQNLVTHQILLREFARIYDVLGSENGVGNGELMDVLRVENRSIKHEVETLRNEVRRTYLAQRIPEILSKI